MSPYHILFFLLSALTVVSTSICISSIDSSSLPSIMPEGRSSKGHQKIEMKKIGCEFTRQVTLSKQRAGIFKKASELSTLCGAEVAILTCSTAGNLYSFGHPCVKSILDRYLNEGTPQEESVSRLVYAYRGANVGEITRWYNDLHAELEAETQKAEELKAAVDANANSCWDAPMDQLNLTDLLHLKSTMSAAKNNITKQIDHQLVAHIPFPSPVLAINSVGASDSSFAFQSTTNTMNTVNNAAIVPHGLGLGFQNGPEHGPSSDRSFAFQSTINTMNTVKNTAIVPLGFGLGFQNGPEHGPF